MIIEKVKGDVLASGHRHIVFAVNTEGINDSGFAGVVARRLWPELMYCGPSPLGQVMANRVGDRTFHAIVCHSLAPGGWDQAPSIVRRVMDEFDECACVAIGAGLVGKMMGADTDEILAAIDAATAKVTLYSL